MLGGRPTRFFPFFSSAMLAASLSPIEFDSNEPIISTRLVGARRSRPEDLSLYLVAW
jgi:hypothetical protein